MTFPRPYDPLINGWVGQARVKAKDTMTNQPQCRRDCDYMILCFGSQYWTLISMVWCNC